MAVQLVHQFKWTDSIECLDRAITLHEQAIASTLHHSGERTVYLQELGNVLQSRFQLTVVLANLDRAIAAQEEAMSLIADTDPHHAVYLYSLRNGLQSLQSRFEQTG